MRHRWQLIPTLSSLMSFTSYLWGRNLGITHFFFSSFMAVGSFLGERRALSPDRRGNNIMLKNDTFFPPKQTYWYTLIISLRAALTDTHWDSPSCSPPPLWEEVPSSGSPDWRSPCRWTESRRHLQASSPPSHPLGYLVDGSSPPSLANFCPSPPEVKEARGSFKLNTWVGMGLGFTLVPDHISISNGCNFLKPLKEPKHSAA